MFGATKTILLCTAFCTALTNASVAIDTLARDITRVEAIREIKDIQRSYAHLAQFGRFKDATSLFTMNATFIWGNTSVVGQSAIGSYLQTHAGSMNGRKAASLNTIVIDNPVVSLNINGKSAKARWNGLRFAGDGEGSSWIEGGIYENMYVRTNTGWRISLLHYYALYEGTYEDGWKNVAGRGLPVIPYHFTPDEAGMPIPPPEGEAPKQNLSWIDLKARVQRLNDEDDIRNVMHAHGYYIDRRMWSDVVDLHTNKTKVTITGQGTFNGLGGVRRALERMGPDGLRTGVNNDHPIFDMLVELTPDGERAVTRGIEIAMRSDANNKTASWEFNVFRNSFAKENNVWKITSIESTPLVVADYYKGWGDGGIHAPNSYCPTWINVRGFRASGILSNSSSSNATVEDLRRRLRRSAAYDGTENQSHAYGYFLDDIDCVRVGSLFATRGHKSSPFAGFFITPQRITDACFASYGRNRSSLRTSISFHWRPQPVILVSQDGRSATLRTRLLQPSTSISKAGSFNSAMYHDQIVLENGRWRLWSVTIDEFYWTSLSWKDGWANPPTRNASQPDPQPAAWIKKFPPDVTIAEVGEREAGFRGGAGKYVEWPQIQRMWFGYRNLVSGRVPGGEKVGYWKGCVPCKLRPDWSLDANGWEEPDDRPGETGAASSQH